MIKALDYNNSVYDIVLLQEGKAYDLTPYTGAHI